MSKSEDHIIESVLDEKHPLEKYVSWNIRSSPWHSTAENNQREAIAEIAKFIIEHDNLCYKCLSKNNKVVSDVLEEEHPLDETVSEIEKMYANNWDITSIERKLLFLISKIALYVKKNI